MVLALEAMLTTQPGDMELLYAFVSGRLGMPTDHIKVRRVAFMLARATESFSEAHDLRDARATVHVEDSQWAGCAVGKWHP